MDLQRFQADDWKVYWAGRWSFLSDTYFGSQYTKKPFTDLLEEGFSAVVFVVRDGRTSCYLKKSDVEAFAERLKVHVVSGKLTPDDVCNELKRQTDLFMSLIDRDEGKDISLEEFHQYLKQLYDYYTAHQAIKYFVEVLNEDELNKYLKKFEEARLYAEVVFTRSEDYIITLSKLIGEKEGYSPELVRAMLAEEFEGYLSGGKLPDKGVLQQRHDFSVLAFDRQGRELLFGTEAEEFETMLEGEQDEHLLKGSVGYKGKVTGKVKVVLDPFNPGEFNEGDILVALMTRPEYVPLMKKAAAIVTDGGGVLSHAAIVARELKKPCVIGTDTATKFLKDGDMVEVDAENGIVRKI